MGKIIERGSAAAGITVRRARCGWAARQICLSLSPTLPRSLRSLLGSKPQNKYCKPEVSRCLASSPGGKNRRRNYRLGLLPGLLLAASAAMVQAQGRNVILIIGDGMDDHQISIARNYLVGARGKLTLDRMPLRGVSQVLTISEQGAPVYVADSANSATAMATGQVTSRGRIATSVGEGKRLETIAEMAHQAGFKTGIVTTSSVTDATPASFMAHINLRFCENPGAMVDVRIRGQLLGDCSPFLVANGGPGSISRQIAESDVDVVLGGGMQHFEPLAEGRTENVLALAAANQFHIINDSSALAEAPGDGKLLGLFSPSTMPVQLRGEDGRKAEPPKPSWANRINKYTGSVELPAVMDCEPNPEFAGMPTLQRMTEAALARLQNDRGFFLMVESASIDKQSHERMPCGSIGELQQLDETLDSALAFAEEHPETLILVTADHSQAAQIIPETSIFAAFGLPIYTPGSLARVRTLEGSVMGVNYATNNFSYEEHTGANVPVFSNAQGLGRVPVTLTQPEIFNIVRDYLGL